MAIALSSTHTQRTYRWTDWKTVQSNKKLIYQYDDDGIVYTIYGYDGPEVHLCNIFKGTVPYNIVEAGYSQVQNDADKIDFENNYLAEANRPVNELYRIQTDTFTSLTSGTISKLYTPFSSFSLTVKTTGAVLTWSIILEGSIDGVNFTPIATHTNLVGNNVTIFPGVNKTPCLYFRTRCSGLALGLGTNVIATVIGVP